MDAHLLLQLLVNGLIVGALYGVVAMSFVLIYKASQVVNFAQGEFLLIGAWVCWWLLTKYQLPFAVGMLITFAFMLVFGIALQVLVLRPLIGEPVISVIMVTIGLSIFFQALCKWMFGVFAQPFPPVFPAGQVRVAGFEFQPVYLMSLAISLLMMAGLGWFFRVSKHGLAMRATAFDQQVAQSLGISVKSVFAMAWAISALVSAVAGVTVGVVNGVSSALSIYGIKVFPAVILGGLDSIVGAVIGGLIVGVLENLAQYVDGQYLHWGNMYEVAPFYVLILILMVRPYGLFGTRDIERHLMAGQSLLPAGDFRASYAADTTIFPTRLSRAFALAGIAALALAPLVLDRFWLSLLIQIGYSAIAALGLNVLVGFTGQISIGHAAFFGFGAFASAWLNNRFGVPVFFSVPLGALLTTAVGMIFGLPAARLKGLYLAIATLAAQYILQDFFARADWFTGGVAGTPAEAFSVLGFSFDTDARYFYVVLAYLVASFVLATNLMRTRDGRALVAVRDHYLSAEIMGINLTKYRTLSFGISAFFAGLGGALYGHYLQFVSVEGFGILLSIQFLGMIIIGGLGSIMGTLLGTAFMVLLPEAMGWLAGALRGGALDRALALKDNISFLREMAIGLVIVLFLMFEPDGLAHRWRQIKAYWKLYPFSH